MNIPGWDWRRDDQAVCLNEVKYGLLAQVIVIVDYIVIVIIYIYSTQYTIYKTCICLNEVKYGLLVQVIVIVDDIVLL